MYTSHRSRARKWKHIEQTNPMEPKGDEGSVVVVTYIREIRVIEELSEEDEKIITDTNNLIYAAATIMTQTLNELSK